MSFKPMLLRSATAVLLTQAAHAANKLSDLRQ